MTTTEQENAAYMAGDTARAGLLARIDDLQRALGESIANNEELRETIDTQDEMIEELREELAETQGKLLTPCPVIGEIEFIFDHPNGDELTCHIEIDDDTATLTAAYLGAVDVHGLLPLPIIDQIEAEALRSC